MAVYERTYKRYKGPVTVPTWRFLVIPRYAIRDVFKSRALVFFYAICFVPTLVMGAWIYLRNNLDLLTTVFDGAGFFEKIEIGSEFFGTFMNTQSGFAFLLTLFVGPGLVSRDLANNGLPLYLSRPISRAEYVLGKIAVLFLLLSGITWVPGLALFGLQGSLAAGWLLPHLRIAAALTFGFWLWILLLALLALALSAWVKWKPVAAFMMFLLFAFSPLFALFVNQLFRSRHDWGHLVNPSQLIEIVWAALLGNEPPDGPPVMAAWAALLVMTGFCLFLLHRKLRAYEVVS